MRINEVELTEGSSGMGNYFRPKVSFSLAHIRNTARLLGLTYVPKIKEGRGRRNQALLVWTNLASFYPVK